VIGARVSKYLGIAKAARGCREVLDRVSAQNGSGSMNRTVIEFRHFGVKSKEQFLLRALSRKSETP